MKPGPGLSATSAARLRPMLERFYAEAPQQERVGFDPVQFPRRYSNPRDVEVAGLIAASLAYGRVDFFVPKVELLLKALGPSPAAYLQRATVARVTPFLEDFVYRFNVGADLAVLLLGIGKVERTYGSLEACFASGLRQTGTLQGALSGLTTALLDLPLAPIEAALGKTRGLAFLLPNPLGTSASKRLNMYLRWMVRGPDAVDLGIWKTVSPSVLMVPLDTHIARIAKRLGLTRRNDLGWKTAEEITASLRRIDADDPVRFDFALCHHGMSGVCSPSARKEACGGCVLQAACEVGKRFTRPPFPRARRGVSGARI